MVRQRVREALQRTAAPAMRLDRFDQCGSGCTVQRKVGEARLRLSANYCHDRFCLPCATARSRRIAGSLKTLCEKRDVRHLVLTLRHTKTPLGGQFDRLVKAFARLRRTKCWTDNVRAGAYFFEVKRSQDGEYFHPHLHVLLVGSYMDQKRLSGEWLRATGDSTYVFIKAVSNNDQMVRYAAKYASKPFDPSVLRDNDWLDQCVVALRGRRMCSTFGEWRGVELEGDGGDSGEWVAVGRLDALVRDADAGSRATQGLLAMLSPRWAERYGFAPSVLTEPAPA